MQTVDPGLLVYFPDEQDMQPDCPVLSWYLPTLQLTHDSAPRVEYFPDEHILHIFEPEVAYLPASHAPHPPCP